VTAWKRSRAEDERRLFRRPPPAPPHATLDFIDYVVSDPERLVFTANALLGPLCERMMGEGSHARFLTLMLSLANGQVWRHTLRSARPTASRAAWLRLVRQVLERLTVPDAVAGIELRIESTEPASAIQGDLFDPGFGTAAGVETALVRLLETQDDVLVRPDADAHPLPERRGRAFTPAASVLTVAGGRHHARDPAVRSVPEAGEAAWGNLDVSGLTLQLLPEPRPVRVEILGRRDHLVPVRYCDDRWRAITTAAGPERISGGQWEHAYAREYYRCVTADGVLVWLFREAGAGRWFLQGWWD
jgi:hypothetical protein